MDNRDELINFYELHLNMLSQWGIDHLSAIEGTTDMLLSDIDDEITLTDEDRRKLLSIANQSSKKYLQLIRQMLNEIEMYREKEDKKNRR